MPGREERRPGDRTARTGREEGASNSSASRSQTPALLDSVILLVNLYDQSRQYDKAIALLRRETSSHACSQLHKMLGNFLSKTNKAKEAADVYTSVMSSVRDEAAFGGAFSSILEQDASVSAVAISTANSGQQPPANFNPFAPNGTFDFDVASAANSPGSAGSLISR